MLRNVIIGLACICVVKAFSIKNAYENNNNDLVNFKMQDDVTEIKNPSNDNGGLRAVQTCTNMKCNNALIFTDCICNNFDCNCIGRSVQDAVDDASRDNKAQTKVADCDLRPCKQSCRRMSFYGGACVNGKCKCYIRGTSVPTNLLPETEYGNMDEVSLKTKHDASVSSLQDNSNDISQN